MKWNEAKLFEVTTFLNRGSAPKYVEADGICIVNQKCVRDNVVKFQFSKRTSADKRIQPERFLVEGDCIVNSTGTGTLGRTAYIKDLVEPTTVDTHVTIVRPNPEKVFPRFLGYQLVMKERFIEAMGKGSTNQIELSANDLGELDIVLPPLPTQRRIAGILSAYDDLIENNLKRIKLLEEAAQNIYREWFVEMRFPGWEDVKWTVDGEGRRLPEGWLEKQLSELITSLRRGRSPKYSTGDGYRVLNQKCIRDWKIDFKSSKVSSYDRSIPEHSFIHLYDILVNSTGTGTLGRMAIVNTAYEKVFVDTHITIVRANPSLITPLYLGYTIYSQQRLVENMGKGSTNQIELSRNDLGSLLILVPPEDIQRRFHQLIEPAISGTANLSSQVEMLKEARDILLPRLMDRTLEV